MCISCTHDAFILIRPESLFVQCSYAYAAAQTKLAGQAGGVRWRPTLFGRQHIAQNVDVIFSHSHLEHLIDQVVIRLKLLHRFFE